MRVIENKSPPATVASIAAMEYRAVKAFRGVTQAERIKKSHGLIDRVRPMMVAAAEIVGMSKSELIEKVKKNYETLGPALMLLAEATQAAEAVREIVQAAEIRLAVALAAVEGEDEPDGLDH
jgi:hypothetical protein